METFSDSEAYDKERIGKLNCNLACHCVIDAVDVDTTACRGDEDDVVAGDAIQVSNGVRPNYSRSN